EGDKLRQSILTVSHAANIIVSNEKNLEASNVSRFIEFDDFHVFVPSLVAVGWKAEPVGEKKGKTKPTRQKKRNNKK
ncbi:hypothetical protein CCACVL1_29609, partial [Corchorus capsularis]